MCYMQAECLNNCWSVLKAVGSDGPGDFGAGQSASIRAESGNGAVDESEYDPAGVRRAGTPGIYLFG